jgi:hypothetical protein
MATIDWNHDGLFIEPVAITGDNHATGHDH